MSVSFVPCPSCQSLLLSDTVQCPTCNHILDPERAADLTGVRLHSEETATQEVPCPDCGEPVRRELVRCWKCGGFLRQQIADSYYKKLETQQSDAGTPLPGFPASSELPHSDVSEAPVHPPSAPDTGSAAIDDQDGDDDFELAPEIAQAVDGWGESDVPAASVPAEGAAESGTYSLTAQAEMEASPPDQPAAGADVEAAPSVPEDSKDESHAPETEDAEAKPAAQKRGDQEVDVAHSVATGGDALLNIALEEERESVTRQQTRGRRQQKGGTATPKTGFIIFCAHGHQIEVQERHRGMMGRCPKCKVYFHVPQAEWDKPKPVAQTAATAGATAGDEPAPAETSAKTQKYRRWMTDVHFHTVDPKKLKLKPGSLAGSFDLVDLGLAVDGLLTVKLAKGGGLLGSSDKKRLQVREAMLAHLGEDKPLEELAVAAHHWYDAQGMKIQVVQPAPYAHESMFAGVPVFGAGRIAVRVPQGEDDGELQFLSFSLSEFREFGGDLAELFGLQNLGEDCGVPLTDAFVECQCHYSDETLRVLENVEFYEADPGMTVKLVGWRCQGCGLVVSEDSRKKERIGGASGRGIAKAKCPKCEEKFGSNPLHTLDSSLPASAQKAPDSDKGAE